MIVDLANWWSLRTYKKARAADLAAVMDAKHAELLAWLETLTPEQLVRDGEVSQVGRVRWSSSSSATGRIAGSTAPICASHCDVRRCRSPRGERGASSRPPAHHASATRRSRLRSPLCRRHCERM